MTTRVLVVDDEPRMAEVIGAALERAGHACEVCTSGAAALAAFDERGADVIVTDWKMPDMDGLALLRAVRERRGDVPVILVTAHGSVPAAVAAMREGAFDYVTKPFDNDELRALVDRALALSRLERENRWLREEVRSRYGPDAIVAESASTRAVLELVRRVAPSRAAVLVQGESGTGKELVARLVHFWSDRVGKPFVAVNVKAFAEGVVESELFGHEKGAFTGAQERRAGYFELADSGTIFLDEITEMSPSLQAKYLRVLQDGVIRRLGGKAETKVDIRVMAATNRDAAEAVRDKAFREDLYYRVNVLAITLPPLRRRLEDVPLLVEAFISEFNEKYERQVKSVDDATMTRLLEHSWPGNIRELRNIIERSVVTCEGDLISPQCLPFRTVATDKPERADAVLLPLGTTLEQGERELILRTLESVNNNKTRAAAILGTTPKTLHNKTRRWRSESGQIAS